jgi:hypothetical protein
MVKLVVPTVCPDEVDTVASTVAGPAAFVDLGTVML